MSAILSRFPGARIIDVRIPNAPDNETSETDMPPDPGVDPAADDDETDI